MKVTFLRNTDIIEEQRDIIYIIYCDLTNECRLQYSLAVHSPRISSRTLFIPNLCFSLLFLRLNRVYRCLRKWQKTRKGRGH